MRITKVSELRNATSSPQLLGPSILSKTHLIFVSFRYAVSSYLLQAKDRHNGNVMLSERTGSLMHIDFGFIFDISPGRDMRFESAAFKLTMEMVELMGGTESQLYRWFQEITVRAFLLVRDDWRSVCALPLLMFDSTLACFKPKSLQNLQSRFFIDVDEKTAAERMTALVLDSCNKTSTNLYDWIQQAQQRIYYFKGEQNEETPNLADIDA